MLPIGALDQDKDGLIEDAEGIAIFADIHSRLIDAFVAENAAVETLEHLVLDLVLPRLIAVDGSLVLHGALVQSRSGAAFGIIGDSGMGKSSMAGSFHSRGLGLMSDDAIVISHSAGRCEAKGIYPSLRLLPDALENIFPTRQDTKIMADYSDKRRVPFDAGPDSAPLVALFNLAEPADRISTARLAPAAACMAVVANSFALDASDLIETRRRFVQATNLVGTVPVFDLHYPRDFKALPDVHAEIFQTLDTLLLKDPQI